MPRLQGKVIRGVDGNWDHIMEAHGVSELEVISVFRKGPLRPRRNKRAGSERGGKVMRKKYSKSQLQALERGMRDPSKWEAADHTVSYRGPTSVRFPLDTLKKLQAIAKATQKPVNRLVNEFVKPFVDGEYALLERLK